MVELGAILLSRNKQLGTCWDNIVDAERCKSKLPLY